MNIVYPAKVAICLYAPDKCRVGIERLASGRAITQGVEVNRQPSSQVVRVFGVIRVNGVHGLRMRLLHHILRHDSWLLSHSG